MRSLHLILRIQIPQARRWLREHGFQLLALWPLVAGGFLWTVSQSLPELRQPLVDALSQGGGSITPALLLSLLLAGSLLPSTLRSLYPRSSTATFIAALPIPPIASFHVQLLACWGKALLPAAFLLILVRLLAAEGPGWVALGAWGLGLFAALILLALWQFIALQILVHWRLLRALPMLCLAVALTLTLRLASLFLAPEGAWYWFPALTPSACIDSILRLALGLPGLGSNHLLAAWGASFLFLYGSAWTLFRRWHRRDQEKAMARLAGRGKSIGLWNPQGPVGAQTRRDLILVLRRFSPAVYLLFATSLGLLLATDRLVASASLEAYWQGRLALVGCLAAVVVVVSISPLLLRHQLPRFWLERSSGVERRQVWLAKLWLARCLALPVVSLGGGLILSRLDASLGERALMLLELLLAGWMATSILGISSFETADQPLLGLLFGGLLAVAMAGFMVFYRGYWPLGVVAYLWVFSLLSDRANERVKMMEVEW